MRKKQTAAAIICVISFLVNGSFPSLAKDIKVNYSYMEDAAPGEVRYVSQIDGNEFYYEDYWGKYAPYSSGECGTACISMALSYLGIDKTPKELGDYWILQGYTEGVPFSTVFGDVPEATGGHSYDFFTAYERYENEEGVSPVIIYLTKELNPYRSGNRHFVLVTDFLGDGKYSAVDPASSERLTVKIVKDEDGELSVSLEAKNGEELSGKMTQYQLSSAQYYIESDAKEDSKFNKPEEKPLTDLKNEAEKRAENEEDKAIASIESIDDKKDLSTKAEATVSVASESFNDRIYDKAPYSAAAKKITAAIRVALSE